MGLVSTQAHVLGRDQKFFASKETVMGTWVKPTALHAADVLSTSIVPNKKRKDRLDAYMASRDILERITDREEHTWSAEMYLTPAGTDAEPDFGDMITCAMGTVTDGSAIFTYSLNSAQTVSTLSITRHVNEIWQEALAGAWVEEMKLSLAGGEEPKVSFSGGAMTYALTVPGVTNGIIAPGATTMVLTAGTGQAVMTNASAVGGAGAGARSVIQINDGSSPDTNVEVTVDSARPSFTTTAMTNGSATAAAVTPYVPGYTTAGSPISGVNGSITHAGLSAVITGFELTLKNNLKPFDDEAFTANVRDLVPGVREITGSLNLRMRQDHLIYIANRAALTTVAITVVAGTGTYGRFTISIPYAELLWSEAQIPQTEEATISLPFKALGSSGNDAFTIVHQ